MIRQFLMGNTLTIVRDGPEQRDSTGSVVPGPPVQISVPGSGIYSPYGVTVGSSQEQQSASDTVATDRVFGAPLGTEIRPTDRIIDTDGRRWQVIGTPVVFPLTSLARVEVAVKEVTG